VTLLTGEERTPKQAEIGTTTSAEPLTSLQIESGDRRRQGWQDLSELAKPSGSPSEPHHAVGRRSCSSMQRSHTSDRIRSKQARCPRRVKVNQLPTGAGVRKHKGLQGGLDGLSLRCLSVRLLVARCNSASVQLAALVEELWHVPLPRAVGEIVDSR
jgi:hypothetical protein